MLRVEEARHPELGKRPGLEPGLYARHRVAAGGERVGDLADLVGPGQPGHQSLRGPIGVEGLLVLGPAGVVEAAYVDDEPEQPTTGPSARCGPR